MDFQNSFHVVTSKQHSRCSRWPLVVVVMVVLVVVVVVFVAWVKAEDHGDDGGNWWCWCCWLCDGGVNDYVSNWQAKPVKKKYSVLPKLKTLTRTAQL